MGHLGFSYVGLIYLLMLFVPNLIWSRNQSINHDNIQENKVLLAFERIGQVCCTCSVLIFSDFNITVFSTWSLWLIASFFLMVLYEICWVRYFNSRNEEKSIYRSFWGIPVPLASLPVMAFLLLGIYGRVVWLILFAVIIGIGHIGIHIQHFRAQDKYKLHY